MFNSHFHSAIDRFHKIILTFDFVLKLKHFFNEFTFSQNFDFKNVEIHILSEPSSSTNLLFQFVLFRKSSELSNAD